MGSWKVRQQEVRIGLSVGRRTDAVRDEADDVHALESRGQEGKRAILCSTSEEYTKTG